MSQLSLDSQDPAPTADDVDAPEMEEEEEDEEEEHQLSTTSKDFENKDQLNSARNPNPFFY